MITTMITRGSPACQSSWGIQLHSVRRLRISDWAMPMARPAAVVSPNERNPPSRAAARAGTINRLVVPGSSPAMGAMKITAAPASIEAIIQLMAASRTGECPSSTAPFSLSAAARVARPKRVRWNTTASTAVATATSPSSHSRSAGICTPATSMTVDGRIASGLANAAPWLPRRWSVMPNR